jgi:hypothetical protein
MANLGASDVTVSVSNTDRHIMGGKLRLSMGSMSFGDGAKTYPHGGIPVTYSDFAFNKALDRLQPVGPMRNGYDYRFDATNDKLKIFAPAPPIVFEELVDCDADVAYLKYPAAFVMYVASADIRHDVVSGKVTPAAGQVAVDLASGQSSFAPGYRCKLTFPSGEGAAATYVTYVTQAWKEVVDNLVVDEEPSFDTNVFTLSAPLAVAIQNATWDDDGTVKACVPQYKGETATGVELELDWGEGTPDSTTLTMAAGFSEADDHLYVTYIKKPSSGFLADRFEEEDDVTPTTDVCTCSSGGNLSNMLIFGTMGCLPGPASSGYAEILRSGATLGTTATNSKITNNWWVGGYGADTITLGSDHADTKAIKISYIWGRMDEIRPLEMLELPDGEIVQSTSLDFMAWGK